MLQLTFKQSNSEMLVRAAASVLFGKLVRSGAKLVSISDLAERPQYGFTASAALEPVGPKFVRITDLQDGKIDWDSVPFCECAEPEKYLLQDDDLLFARTGATTGKTHLVKDAERAVFASYLIRLRPKSGVFAGYLHSFFQSDAYWTQISDEKEGSAQPNVNGEKLAALQIPRVELKLQHAIAEFLRCVRRRQDGEKVELPDLPAPLAEQRRVVARIEELAAQIHEARTLRHQAAEEAEALLPSAAASRFSDNFPQVRLEEVCPVITDGTHQTPRYTEDGATFLSAKNVKPFRFMPEEHRKVSLEDFRGYTANNKPQRGDVLLTRVGAGIGEAAIIDQDIEFAIYVSLALIRTDSTRLSPEFLVHWLNSPVGRASSHRKTLGRGTSQGNLNLKLLRGFMLPVPPLPEQRRIVTELDALQAEVDALKRLQAETTAELDALLPALLDRAFKGEL